MTCLVDQPVLRERYLTFYMPENNTAQRTSKIIKGIHDVIIPEEIFWRAYYTLQEKVKPQGPKTISRFTKRRRSKTRVIRKGTN